MNTQELYNLLIKRDKSEITSIILTLLLDNKLNYTELSEIYVKYLEEKDGSNRELVCDLTISLTAYKDKQWAGTKKALESKANDAIIRSRMFKGTKYEEKLKQKINENMSENLP